jgi:primary-amine oxidase
MVHPGLVAANHQHWFNLRLDFDIDGTANAVMENNLDLVSHREAGDRGFTASHTVFGRAVDARRDMNDMTARSWTIYNPAAVDRMGRPAGYTIAPMDNAMTVFPPARQHGPAGFTAHHLWVTPYDAGQRYAAGPYPNQATDDAADTLDRSAGDAPIYDRDIVVWYSLGMTHFPRVENYPVMSNDRLSVVFRPDGFFARNPALDLGQVSDDQPVGQRIGGTARRKK